MDREGNHFHLWRGIEGEVKRAPGASHLRIGIDARLAHWPGVGRYLEEIIRNLALIDSQNSYVVYHHANPASRRYAHRYRHTDLVGLVRNPNFSFCDVRCPSPGLVEHLALPHLLRKHRVQVLHSPFIAVPLLKVCPQVVTIHDLVELTVPHTFPSAAARVYVAFMTWWALRFADQVVTVSRFVQTEIMKVAPRCRARIQAIHNGVGPQFQPVRDRAELDRVRECYQIQKDYCLYIGTLKPNKNVDTLIQAFHQMKSHLPRALQLVIVAKADPRYPSPARTVKMLGMGQEVLFVDYVKEADLPALYTGATMLLLPSLHEGFGFPILEAMACGTPVITSIVTAMPEVAGDAAILVDPTSVGNISEAMLRLANEPDTAEILRDKGLKRAAQFSWIRTAEQLRAVYESCAGTFSRSDCA
jgi:glycosyltransferase involved in cell wall biosynthesis